MAKTEVAAKVEPGVALRMDPGQISREGGKRVYSPPGAGGMHFKVRKRRGHVARWWLATRTLYARRRAPMESSPTSLEMITH